MIWEPWSRMDIPGLARYVSAEAAKSIAIPPLHLDLELTPANRLTVIQGLYEYLLSLQIQYALEEYHPSSVLQNVRAPGEVAGEHQGTCLDLTALFCGLCLRCELLPLLIVPEGHALAAVFLSHGLREWNQQRPGRALFDAGPLTDPAGLREMIGQGLLVAVECTGFARSKRLEEHPSSEFPETMGRKNGVMTFENAQAAGQAQIGASRKFGFALDIAVAHYGWRIAPLPAAPLYTSFRAAVGDVQSHILIRQFEATIKDKTEDFVGRRKLIQRIDECLADQKAPSGYVVLRGEPGTGKTALMAHLVRQRAYIHHFNIFNQRIRSSREFLENVCAQVILRYGLDRPALPAGAGKNSGPMVALLAEAAEREKGNAIVVVVDALDESEPGASREGANRLLLPESLPDNVFFLVTTREQIDYRLVVKNRHDLSFHDVEFKEQNDEDIQLYIVQFLQRYQDAMQTAIAQWQIDAAEFTRVVSSRADGNFMYLVNVLKDIRDKKINKDSLDTIEQLPEGLIEYYARHWRMMRDLDKRRFEKYYEPVVCILAAVRQPVELDYVRELTRLDIARVKEVIEEWRQFLRVDPMPNGAPVYSIYHSSFREFLLDKVGIDRYKDMIRDNTLSKVTGL
jgi:hypothetical protein